MRIRSSRALCAVLLLLASFSAANASPKDSANALRFFQAQRYDDAIASGIQGIQKDPKNIDGYLAVCWSYLKQEKWSEAFAWGNKASLVQRFDYRIVEILGTASFNLGKNEEALKYYQDYVMYLPEGSSLGSSYATIGEIYIRLGQYAHADIALTTAANFLPSDATIRARQAYAREQSGDLSYAEDAYLAAIKLNPTLEDAKLGLSRVRQKMRD